MSYMITSACKGVAKSKTHGLAAKMSQIVTWKIIRTHLNALWYFRIGVLAKQTLACLHSLALKTDISDPPLPAADIEVDSRDNPQQLIVHLRHRVGCHVYFGRTYIFGFWRNDLHWRCLSWPLTLQQISGHIGQFTKYSSTRRLCTWYY